MTINPIQAAIQKRKILFFFLKFIFNNLCTTHGARLMIPRSRSDTLTNEPPRCTPKILKYLGIPKRMAFGRGGSEGSNSGFRVLSFGACLWMRSFLRQPLWTAVWLQQLQALNLCSEKLPQREGVSWWLWNIVSGLAQTPLISSCALSWTNQCS